MPISTWIRVRSMVVDGLKVIGFMATIGSATAGAATLAPGVQQKLSAATFEVVLGKPVSDPLTYEKPLPFDLIPYRERTDKFQSIGTAFAIGPNRFVTAAHVISAGNGSQYGPIALRDTAGTVYRVDKIIKYSQSEDYAVFSVVGAPTIAPLETRTRPPVNTPVFAVGNALGEGVVARDGLYTSDTPEELDGRWQWIRFSAAASPGDSGGPLIDRNGKVVGVILRKSPNENLNFALAIQQVMDGGKDFGLIESRSSYRIAVMKVTDAVNTHEKIPLPKPIDEFYESMRQLSLDIETKVQTDYLKNHADAIFPRGNSDQLLKTVYAEAFPKLISQSDGGAWALVGDAPKKMQLDNNGYLQESATNGVDFLRIKAPDNLSEVALVADSKQFMDLILKGKSLFRPVGTDVVRVTSMGAAAEESWFTDAFRRKWQVRYWLSPYNDSAVISVALPTPDGMVMLLAATPTSIRETMVKEMELVCNFVYLSYTGTLSQWQAFLSETFALPASVSNLQFQVDYSRGLSVTSSRFRMNVPVDVLKVDANSVLMLKYSFMHDAAGVEWGLGGAYLADREQSQKWVGVLRREKPTPAMPEESAARWRTLTTSTHPWDGEPFMTGGRTETDQLANLADVVAGKTTIAYEMTLNVEGPQSIKLMKNQFMTLRLNFTDYR